MFLKQSSFRRCVKGMMILAGVMVCFGLYTLSGLEELRFSVESGFYQEPFYLKITSSKEGEIYYTLDGSLPDKTSNRYREPIYLKNASENENVLSARTDTARFYKNIPPDYKVDKGNVVRAVLYDENGVMSDVITGTFFVGGEIEQRLCDDLAVVSLVTAPENLVDYETGIYIEGATTERARHKMELDDHTKPHEYRANYRNRGKEWEREVYFTFFSKKHKKEFSQNVGMRVKGGWSRDYEQKSLNLYARPEYESGKSCFGYDFFQTGILESSITLSSGGNDRATKCKEALVYDLSEELAFISANSEPCIVFLNGEYWGLYWLSEHMNQDYIEKHYGISEANMIVIENHRLAEGKEENFGLYEEFRDFIAQTDFKEDAAYEELEKRVDIQSMIDYYSMNIYIYNIDWPHNNYSMWRSVDKGSRWCEDTRWRWISYDVNHEYCMNPKYIDQNYLEEVAVKDELLGQLLKNSIFRQRFYNSLLNMAEFTFVPKLVQKELYILNYQIGRAMKEDYRRFQNRNVRDTTFEKSVDEIQQFFNKRGEYIKEHIKSMEKENMK